MNNVRGFFLPRTVTSNWLSISLVAALGISAIAFAQKPTVSAPNMVSNWEQDYSHAKARAKAQNKIMLVYFSASWCGHCRWYRLNVFPTAEFKSATKNMVLVDVDIDENKALADKFGVREMPDVQLRTEGGKLLSEVRGYPGPGPIMKAIEVAKKKVKKK